jgi:hypothetical protein
LSLLKAVKALSSGDTDRRTTTRRKKKEIERERERESGETK